MARLLRSWFTALRARGHDRDRAALARGPAPTTAARRYDWLTPATIVLVTGTYFAIQIVLVRKLPLVMDEFDGAYDVYRLRRQIPYLDYRPYKTVLGYYLELPPLLLTRDVWSGVIGTKLMLAGLAAIGMAAIALQALRVFPARAIVFALPLWAFMTNWVDRSSELRVDMLTSLAGMFSLVWLLRDRPASAGVAAGLSFLISQKGVYYLAAAFAALGVAWLVAAPRGPAFTRAVRFVVGCAAMVGPYMAVFSTIASWHATTSTTFSSHNAIVFTEMYPHIRKFWTQSLDRNPVYYALGVAGYAVLTARVAVHSWRREVRAGLDRDLVLLVYALVLGAGLVWHKQPWPYFFVLLVPTCLFLHAAVIEATWDALDRVVRPWFLRLPIVAGLLGGALYAGVYLPAQRIPVLLKLDNGYQRHMVRIASALLKPDDQYFAAVDFLYDREHTPGPLRRVSYGRRMQLAHTPRPEVRAIVDALRSRPPKIVIRNERYRGLPYPVRRFFDQNYFDFWGSIRLYAPRFEAGKKKIWIAFPGVYQLATDDGTSALVDSARYLPGKKLRLKRGTVTVHATSGGRLRLTTSKRIVASLDPRYRRPRGLFPAIYSR